MNIHTIKLLVWAAMHHSYFRYVRFESPVVLGFFAAYDRRFGFEIFVQPARIRIPYSICDDYNKSAQGRLITPDDIDDIPF